MNLSLDSKLASLYKSQSQKVRILTENWVASQVYCPACGKPVQRYQNNKPVADFFCLKCCEDFELKSKNGAIGSRVLDGAYGKMIERLKEDSNPNFFFMSYDLRVLKVVNMLVIPKHFFTSDIIEKRNPLAPSARRAGWVGCNILLHSVPQSGRIFLVKNNEIIPKDRVLETWNKTCFLRSQTEPQARGWILDIMKRIDSIGMREFSLRDIYACEEALKAKHPSNSHVKDKIRQQLQVLRDKRYLTFLGHGRYRLNIP